MTSISDAAIVASSKKALLRNIMNSHRQAFNRPFPADKVVELLLVQRHKGCFIHLYRVYIVGPMSDVIFREPSPGCICMISRRKKRAYLRT